MTKKTPRVYTLDELKEKSQKASDDPKLVEIVKSALQNKDGKVNCTWAYKEAEKYVHDQTKDLQKTKELAVATRFLAMLRRDHKKEFEKLVAQEEQSGKEIKTETRKKLFHEIEFKLAHGTFAGVELTTRESGWGHAWQVEHYIRFHADHENDYLSPREIGKKFYMEILYALMETATHQESADLLNDLTQLLEEKFGLKIKICGNCKDYFNCNNDYYDPARALCIFGIKRSEDNEAEPVYQEKVKWPEKIAFNTCEHWTPKKVPEKPSSA